MKHTITFDNLKDSNTGEKISAEIDCSDIKEFQQIGAHAYRMGAYLRNAFGEDVIEEESNVNTHVFKDKVFKVYSNNE